MIFWLGAFFVLGIIANAIVIAWLFKISKGLHIGQQQMISLRKKKNDA